MYLPKVHVEICPANLFSRLFNAFINFSIVQIHISSVHTCACSLFFVYSDLRSRYSLHCAVLSCSVVLDPVTPWTAPARLLCPWAFSRQEYWSGLPCPPPGDLTSPRIGPRSPVLQPGSLLIEPPWKPKNTGVGSLSHLQGIFPTQESNPGLLHCRHILYQLSYRGNPIIPSITQELASYYF